MTPVYTINDMIVFGMCCFLIGGVMMGIALTVSDMARRARQRITIARARKLLSHDGLLDNRRPRR
jgi:hypothetical protein